MEIKTFNLKVHLNNFTLLSEAKDLNNVEMIELSHLGNLHKGLGVVLGCFIPFGWS